jgi:hypothetical protein
MKLFSNFSYLTVACLSLMVLASPASAETDYACTRSADGAIIIDSAQFGVDGDPNSQGFQASFVEDIQGNIGNSCKEVPDAYKVTFYRMALCAVNPVTNNNSLEGCTLLLNDNAGVEHVIEGTDKSAPLDTSSADPVIAAGRYSFLALVLSNELKIKHNEKFVLKNGSPATLRGKTGQGEYCWTNDAITTFTDNLTDADYPDGTIVNVNPNDRSTLGMECGSTPGTAQYSTEIMDSFGEGPDNGNPGVFQARDQDPESEVQSGTAILLTADNETTATNAINAKRILVAIPSAADVTEISQFELQFTLTRAVSIDMYEDSGVITALKNGADPFSVSLKVTN